MRDYDISDIELLPSSDLSRLVLRVTRFSNLKGPLSFQGILPSICEYLSNQGCPRRVNEAKRVSLDGSSTVSLDK
jgi:hypothetical protein